MAISWRGTDLPPAGSREECHLLDQVIGPEPTPEFAAILADDYRRLDLIRATWLAAPA